MTLIWIIVFTTLGGVLSVFAAATFLLMPPAFRARSLPTLVSFAIGTLLGAAFLALIPHAIEAPASPGAHAIGITVLVGLLVFFSLEKLVLWRHCHNDHCETHAPDFNQARDNAAASLIIIGDSIHNLVDGVLIAGAFIIDIRLGIVTSLAVISHEIPQEVGNFALLLNGGFSRSRAFLFNTITSLTTIIGGVSAYFFLNESDVLVPYILAVAAASFIYIAVADLIPGLHRRTEITASLQQLVLIILGALLIFILHTGLH